MNPPALMTERQIAGNALRDKQIRAAGNALSRTA
jgi:hypothetical protein